MKCVWCETETANIQQNKHVCKSCIAERFIFRNKLFYCKRKQLNISRMKKVCKLSFDEIKRKIELFGLEKSKAAKYVYSLSNILQEKGE